MNDRAVGVLEVGSVGGEVIINHPDLKPDEQGVGHIVFSPAQARNLAHSLLRQANIAEEESKPVAPPTDFGARVLTDGSPVTPDHREIEPETGQQKAYVVLSEEERSRGYVRPVRRSYVHQKCGSLTTMGLAIAQTYAREPKFYCATFCCACRDHFPVGEDGEFVWEDGSKVGS